MKSSKRDEDRTGSEYRWWHDIHPALLLVFKPQPWDPGLPLPYSSCPHARQHRASDDNGGPAGDGWKGCNPHHCQSCSALASRWRPGHRWWSTVGHRYCKPSSPSPSRTSNLPTASLSARQTAPPTSQEDCERKFKCHQQLTIPAPKGPLGPPTYPATLWFLTRKV